MAKKTLSIEVGDSIVKVAILKGAGKASKVTNAFCFRTPNGAVTDGLILQKEQLAHELSQQLAKRKLGKIKDVIFVLATTKIVTREVTIPPVKPSKIKELIVANAAEYFPMEIENYRLAYTIIEKQPGKEGQYRVFISLMPTKMMIEYRDMAASIGLNVIDFDHVANCQYQLFRALPGSELTMFVGVSTHQTVLTFLQGNNLLMQRTFPFGCDELMQSAIEQGDFIEFGLMPKEEADEDNDDIPSYFPDEQEEDGMYRIVNGISRSADYFKSAHKGAVIDKVVLLDFCAKLEDAADQVGAALDLPVVPFSQLVTGHGIDLSIYAPVAAALYETLAINVQGLDKSSKAAKKPKVDSLAFPIILFLIFFGAGVAVSAVSVLEYLDLQNRERALDIKIAGVEYVNQTYEVYVQYSALSDNLKLLVDDPTVGNAALLTFLSELESKMPQSLLVMSATCSDQSVSMDIEVGSLEDAAVTIAQLRTFSSIEVIQVSNISMVEAQETVAEAEVAVPSVPEGETAVEQQPVVETLEPTASPTYLFTLTANYPTIDEQIEPTVPTVDTTELP